MYKVQGTMEKEERIERIDGKRTTDNEERKTVSSYRFASFKD